MIEGIPLDAGQVGAGGLLVVVIVLILTGRLVWHKILDRLVADKTAENERLWVALTAQQEINRHYAESARDTVESLETITMLVRALPRKEERP